jgi:hypothetical protein
MNLESGKTFGTLVLGAALTVGLGLSGCKSAPPATTPPAQGAQSSQNPQGVQGTMNPNGTFTPSPNQPAGQQAAAAPTPAPNGAPAPTAPAGAPGSPGAPAMTAAAPEQPPPPPPPPPVLPANSSVSVTITQTLAASKNNVGDQFTGVIALDVVHGGTIFFAKGTPVGGEVMAAKGQGKFKGAGDLAIQLTSIGHMRVNSTEYEVQTKGKGKRTAGFIGGGGGAGALIGGLAGGGKGALIGGLVGAGAGTAAGAYTGNKDVVIPSESVIKFRLTSPITLK